MRAYFAGSGVPTPEEMGKMLAPSPEQAAAARKIMSMPVAEKKPLKKKSTSAGALRKPAAKKQP